MEAVNQVDMGQKEAMEVSKALAVDMEAVNQAVTDQKVVMEDSKALAVVTEVQKDTEDSVETSAVTGVNLAVM